MTLTSPDGPVYFPPAVTQPAWGKPARLDFFTFEIDSQDCHCRVRIHRTGVRERRSCPKHGWPELERAEQHLQAWRDLLEDGQIAPTPMGLMTSGQEPLA